MESKARKYARRNSIASDELVFHERRHLFDKGERDQVPGDNAVIHQLQEGGESEGQHLTEAVGRKELSWCGL